MSTITMARIQDEIPPSVNNVLSFSLRLGNSQFHNMCDLFLFIVLVLPS